MGDAAGDESGDPVEYADDVDDAEDEIQSLFSAPPGAEVARENIAILSRTLRLHTSSVLTGVGRLVSVVDVTTFFEPSESVSESVFIPISGAVIKNDDFIVEAAVRSSSAKQLTSDVRLAGGRSLVAFVSRSSVNKSKNRLKIFSPMSLNRIRYP